VPPQRTDGRIADQTFAADEFLFRRVPNSHIEEGELSLLAIRNGFKFEKNPPDCSSVVRSKYCAHFSDALHPDCAENKECPDTTVYFLRVGDLAKGIKPKEAGICIRIMTHCRDVMHTRQFVVVNIAL
jgi:hypothetical protein